jgi:hypothetical protein
MAASGPSASAKSCISPARIWHVQASLSGSVSVLPAINAAKSIRVPFIPVGQPWPRRSSGSAP